VDLHGRYRILMCHVSSYFVPFVPWIVTAMCILGIQRLDVTLKLLSNKMPFYRKNVTTNKEYHHFQRTQNSSELIASSLVKAVNTLLCLRGCSIFN
jgi:hypothetical protein